MDEKHEISKIKLVDVVYDIKDAKARHDLNVLLGIEPPDPAPEDVNENQESEK